MAAINIKNIPDHIHLRLKQRAAANHRSLNKEIVHILAEALAVDSPLRLDPEDTLRRIRTIKKEFRGGLTIDEIQEAIEEGRP